MRLGRNRPRAHGPRLKLAAYLPAQLPPPPASVDYTGPAASGLSQIFLNDKLSDCVCAGLAHIQCLLTANAGAMVAPTDDQVLALYEAIGGYVPGVPSSDNGCDEETALNYVSTTGFPDGTKISGYLELNAASPVEVQQAMWLFENLFFGVELPDAWINPFPSGSGFIWDVGQPDENNGHCFVGVGYNSTGVQIDTWGMIGTVTWGAIASLCADADGGQLFVLLSPDQIAKAQQKAPNGFDWATLQADFAALAPRGGLAP